MKTLWFDLLCKTTMKLTVDSKETMLNGSNPSAAKPTEQAKPEIACRARTRAARQAGPKRRLRCGQLANPAGSERNDPCITSPVVVMPERSGHGSHAVRPRGPTLRRAVEGAGSAWACRKSGRAAAPGPRRAVEEPPPAASRASTPRASRRRLGPR